MGWLSIRLPTAVVWLINEVSPVGFCRGVARKRCGADRSGIRHARRGHLQPSWKGGPLVAAVMIGVDPHKGSHTAVAIGAAEETLGQVRALGDTHKNDPNDARSVAVAVLRPRRR